MYESFCVAAAEAEDGQLGTTAVAGKYEKYPATYTLAHLFSYRTFNKVMSHVLGEKQQTTG